MPVRYLTKLADKVAKSPGKDNKYTTIVKGDTMLDLLLINLVPVENTQPPNYKQLHAVIKKLDNKPTDKRKKRATTPSRSSAPFKFATKKYNKWYATQYMWYKYGWGKHQRRSLILLWTRESGWNEHAHNGSSGAHGIPQALPGSKMATHGKNWQTNPETQIKWGLSYIKARYGTPNGAWAAFQRKGWY